MPASSAGSSVDGKPTLIYNYYNIDPKWRADEAGNRVLLLEPDHFTAYPVSAKCLEFAQALAAEIPGMQTYVGSFETLAASTQSSFIYKEHPLNRHYRGTEDARDWMFEVTGYYRSFFAFWKRCKKEL